MVPSRPKQVLISTERGKGREWYMYVLLTISLYGRCLSSALVTNVCICLQTVIQEDIFSTLGVILYWAGKKGGEGDIDNISPRTMF
jgi:hypothetical protein